MKHEIIKPIAIEDKINIHSDLCLRAQIKYKNMVKTEGNIDFSTEIEKVLNEFGDFLFKYTLFSKDDIVKVMTDGANLFIMAAMHYMNPNIKTDTLQERLNLYESICKELNETYQKKNTDYGDSTAQTFRKYGGVSFAVRIEDKLNRFRTLVNKKEVRVNDESIVDTLIDGANYFILAGIQYIELFESEAA